MAKTANKLTQKEIDTWKLLARGLMYKEIAVTQGVTIDTIKKHSKNIYRKLHVRNRTEAVNRLMSGINIVQANSITGV
jgi:two-component system, NarL family, response regulator LiaR